MTSCDRILFEGQEDRELQLRPYCCFWPAFQNKKRCVWHSSSTQETVPKIEHLLTNIEQSGRTGFKLDEARLSDIRFTDGIPFTDHSFIGAEFSHSSMKEADFSRTRLHGANFSSARLTGATLNFASGKEVNFTDAKMMNTTLHNASFSDCTFINSELSETQADDFSAGIHLSMRHFWLTRN